VDIFVFLTLSDIDKHGRHTTAQRLLDPLPRLPVVVRQLDDYSKIIFRATVVEHKSATYTTRYIHEYNGAGTFLFAEVPLMETVVCADVLWTMQFVYNTVGKHAYRRSLG
jgi:hypothetical protein